MKGPEGQDVGWGGVLPDSTVGPECRFGDWGHLFKSLLTSCIAKAGPGLGGSSSLGPPTLFLLSRYACVSTHNYI